MNRRTALVLAVGCICIACFVAALLAYREHMLNTIDIAPVEQWPMELNALLEKARAQGDKFSDIDVRRAGFITTYMWRMASTDARLKLHIEHFGLQSVPLGGIEQQRVLSRFPHAWEHPATVAEVYAFPPGLPGADDGESEFVLLHDKVDETLYFYYYFNF